MAVEIGSDGQDRRGGELTGVARVPVICVSALNGGGDAVALGTPGIEDGVQRTTASTTVVVAR
jgi:hypothetical protein